MVDQILQDKQLAEPFWYQDTCVLEGRYDRFLNQLESMFLLYKHSGQFYQQGYS